MKRWSFIGLLFICSFSEAQHLFVKAAGGTWGNTTTWSNVSSAGVDNSGPPLITDTCTAELGSGNFTIDSSTDVCGSFSTTDGTGNYGGVLTQNASTTPVIASTFTLNSVMTYTRGGLTSSALSFLGNTATNTITTAGKTVGNITFGGAGGGWILADSLNGSGNTVTISSGSFNSNGQFISAGIFSSNNSNVRTVNVSGSSITLSSGGTAWSCGTVTNMTFSASNSTITFTNTAINTKAFNGGGKTYGQLSLSAGGGGVTSINNSCTFGILDFGAGRPVNFSAGSTTTITTLNCTGSAGNIITIGSATVGTRFFINKTSGNTSCNYINLTDSKAGGGATWLAGNNSIDNGNNNGWIFSIPSGWFWGPL